nr:hypothetical protein [Ornithinimicrobium sp. HY1745]
MAELADIQGGIQKQPKRAPRQNAFPFLRVANVTSHGLDLTDVHAVELFGDELERLRLQRGDLLVVEGNGSPAQIGRAAVWDGSVEDCVHQNHLIRVRPHAGLDPAYLGLVWNSPTVRDELTAVSSSTSGLHTLSVAKLKRIVLPVPSLREQARVVEILGDHLSHLGVGDEALQTAASRLAALQRASLDRLFGQNLTTTLGDLVSDISAGKSFGSAKAPAREDEWGIIKVSAMTWGAFDASQNKAVSAERVDPRYEICAGDLLVSRANTSEYVGASVLVGQVRPRLLLSDKSLRVTPKPDVCPEWLWRALQAPSARRQISSLATGTKDSMRNISQASLRAVRLPSLSLDAQEAALRGFSEIEMETTRLTQSISRQQARSTRLRRALLAAAFAGKLTGRHTDIEVIEELAGA